MNDNTYLNDTLDFLFSVVQADYESTQTRIQAAKTLLDYIKSSESEKMQAKIDELRALLNELKNNGTPFLN